MTKDEIILKVIETEGGYCDNPSDRGGKTKYGITEKVAREFGYTGDMCDLSKPFAVSIYTVNYWNKVKGDELLKIDYSLALEVFDSAVNLGVSRASKILQRAVNVLHSAGLYIDVDGIIGSRTIKAITNCTKKRGVKCLLLAINSLQAMHYIELVERDSSQREFIHGWLLNRVALD